MPAEGNSNLQTLIYVFVARPRRCLTLSNPVPWQNWMAAYLGYTLRMKTLFRGWPVMVHDTHMRRRRRIQYQNVTKWIAISITGMIKTSCTAKTYCENWSLDCSSMKHVCLPVARLAPYHKSGSDATSACSGNRTAFRSQAAHTSASDNWHSPLLSPHTCITQNVNTSVFFLPFNLVIITAVDRRFPIYR